MSQYWFVQQITERTDSVCIWTAILDVRCFRAKMKFVVKHCSESFHCANFVEIDVFFGNSDKISRVNQKINLCCSTEVRLTYKYEMLILFKMPFLI